MNAQTKLIFQFRNYILKLAHFLNWLVAVYLIVNKFKKCGKIQNHRLTVVNSKLCITKKIGEKSESKEQCARLLLLPSYALSIETIFQLAI